MIFEIKLHKYHKEYVYNLLHFLSYIASYSELCFYYFNCRRKLVLKGGRDHICKQIDMSEIEDCRVGQCDVEIDEKLPQLIIYLNSCTSLDESE